MLQDPVTLACPPPDQVFRGSMVYWYNSTSYRDDLAWAAAWMYKATGDQARTTTATSLNPTLLPALGNQAASWDRPLIRTASVSFLVLALRSFDRPRAVGPPRW